MVSWKCCDKMVPHSVQGQYTLCKCDHGILEYVVQGICGTRYIRDWLRSMTACERNEGRDGSAVGVVLFYRQWINEMKSSYAELQRALISIQRC